MFAVSFIQPLVFSPESQARSKVQKPALQRCKGQR